MRRGAGCGDVAFDKTSTVDWQGSEHLEFGCLHPFYCFSTIFLVSAGKGGVSSTLTQSGGRMKQIKVDINIKLSLAACLFGIAAILDVVFR